MNIFFKSLIFFYFFTQLAYSQNDFEVSTSYYLTEKDLTLSQIKTVKDFKTSKGDNFGIIDSYCWLKIEIKNNTNLEQNRYFEFKIPFIDYIDLYYDNKIEKFGQLQNFNTNIKSLNNAAFKVFIKEKENKTIYLRLSSSFAIKTFMNNFSISEYESNLIFYKRIFDFVYGILISMVLYNFFIWLIIKEKSYFYYVSFHFLFILGIVSWTGFGFEYIWPTIPNINQYTYGILGNLIYAFNMLFLIHYLNIKKYLPKMLKYLKLFVYIPLIFAITSIFESYVTVYEVFSIISSFFSIAVTIYLMIVFKLKTAQYLFISKIFLLSGNISLVLSELGFIEGSFFIDNSYIWGVVFEVILMSFALSYKYKLLEYEKELEKTKRIETEELLINKQKLSTLGEMLNNLVHQWRQPLSQINSVVYSIDSDYSSNKLTSTKLDDKLNNIESITNYLSHTLDDFRNFSLDNKKIDSFKIENLLHEVISIIKFSFNTNKISIKSDFKDRNIEVELNKNELVQVLMILLINAKDAIINSKTNDGKVFISVSNNNQLEIEISNNGGSIPPDIRKEIFEPYFTTKSSNEGTGLGLYIAKLIIEDRFNGSLTYSSLDCWSSFKVRI